jgi:hypothetical protein
MSLRIGRLTGLNEPNDWDAQDDFVTLRGSYMAKSVADGMTRRDQLLAYANNSDEPVIPIVIDGETKANGFYRVRGMRMLTDDFVRQRGNLHDYQMDLERIPGYAAPAIESFITGALMVNAHGVAAGTAEPFWALPNSAIEWGLSTAFTQETRPGVLYAGGFLGTVASNIAWMRMNPNYKALGRFAMQPSKFYDNACYISSFRDGAWHPIIGRQESPDGQAWSLDNGLVNIGIAAAGYFQLYWVDASNTFRTSAQLYISGSNVATTGILRPLYGYGGSAVKLMRNSPEEVILRTPVYFDGSNGPAFSPAYIDVSLRRGSRIVRIYLTTSLTESWLFGNAFAGVASTALTGGNVWTANDGWGNRVLIMSAQARTDDLVKGRFTATVSRTTFDVGMSMELAGTASVNRDTAQSQIYQYLTAQAERMQVVGR